jgi:hypothetical protein
LFYSKTFAENRSNLGKTPCYYRTKNFTVARFRSNFE